MITAIAYIFLFKQTPCSKIRTIRAFQASAAMKYLFNLKFVMKTILKFHCYMPRLLYNMIPIEGDIIRYS